MTRAFFHHEKVVSVIKYFVQLVSHPGWPSLQQVDKAYASGNSHMMRNSPAKPYDRITTTVKLDLHFSACTNMNSSLGLDIPPIHY